MSHREIVIRLQLPRFLRGRWSVATIGAIIGFGAIAYATLPVTFTSNTQLKALDLNNDFTNLDSRLTTVEGRTYAWTYGYCSGTAVATCTVNCPSGQHVYGGGCYADHNSVIAQYPNVGAGNPVGTEWICKYSPADTGTIFALCGP